MNVMVFMRFMAEHIEIPTVPRTQNRLFESCVKSIQKLVPR
jgi:hypothetical protein